MTRREALAVLGIVAIGAIPAALMALSLTEFVVMPDELGYVKQATQLGRAELVTPGDFWFNSWALLEPMMHAPLFHFLSSTKAFDAAHLLNAFVMSSTAIPVYLLARQVLTSRPLMYAVALLSVAIPWIGMAGTLMTEVVAYPAFAWATLATVHAAARPSARSDVLLLAALTIAFAARTQLVFLAPAAVMAITLHALAFRSGDHSIGLRLRRGLTEHRVLIGAVVLALVVVLIGGSARFAGNYQVAIRGGVFRVQALSLARETLAYVVVGIGAVPAVLGFSWAFLALITGRTERHVHAFAATTVTFVTAITLVGGVFTASFSNGINDRYVFYVAPLLFLGMAIALTSTIAFRRAGFVAGGVGVCALVAASALRDGDPSLVSPSTALHQVIADVANAVPVVSSTPAFCALVAGLATVVVVVLTARVRPERLALGTLAAVLVFCAGETSYTYAKIASTQSHTDPAFVAGRDWLDRGLPRGSRAAVVLASLGPQRATTTDWWDTAFWNKTVTGIYALPGADRYETAFGRELQVDPDSGRIHDLDAYGYFVRSGLDSRLSLRGSTTAVTHGGLLVVQAERPYRAEWFVRGAPLESGFLAPGMHTTIRAWRDRAPAGTHRVGVTIAAADDASAAIPVRVDSGHANAEGGVKPGTTRTFELDASYTQHGWADIRIAIGASATASARLVAIAQP
ncbi:MAG: hypothetical protein QOJ29_4305 [Thermoleophilaceae bacterium]|jgi:hypothetical protein|nr:hypothetical protein [Thermoleophilaceae bacterium]